MIGYSKKKKVDFCRVIKAQLGKQNARILNISSEPHGQDVTDKCAFKNVGNLLK